MVTSLKEIKHIYSTSDYSNNPLFPFVGALGKKTQDAAANHMALEVVKRPEAKGGFVLLPRRWVGERSQGWMARFRRLARDYEQLAETLKGLHVVAFAMLMLRQLTQLILQSA